MFFYSTIYSQRLLQRGHTFQNSSTAVLTRGSQQSLRSKLGGNRGQGPEVPVQTDFDGMDVLTNSPVLNQPYRRAEIAELGGPVAKIQEVILDLGRQTV